MRIGLVIRKYIYAVSAMMNNILYMYTRNFKRLLASVRFLNVQECNIYTIIYPIALKVRIADLFMQNMWSQV
jgi:hypothetical protein